MTPDGALAGGKRTPRILLTDVEDERALRAADTLARGALVRVVLVGDARKASSACARLGLATAGFEVVDPSTSALREAFRARLSDERDLEPRIAERLMTRPIHFALSMLRDEEGDALLAGLVSPTRDVLLACEMASHLAPGQGLVSGAFVLEVPASCGRDRRRLVFADCAVNPRPSAEQLSMIGAQAADTCRAMLGETPRLAMLSFSTHGSASHPDVERVTRATELLRRSRPDLLVDGELQADAALDLETAGRKLDDPGAVAGRANVLVFPDLSSANIAYKLVHVLSGAPAYGVFVQGYGLPIVKLSRGASTEDIVGAARLAIGAGSVTAPG